VDVRGFKIVIQQRQFELEQFEFVQRRVVVIGLIIGFEFLRRRWRFGWRRFVR
jgi:hypothetical protein